MFPPGSDPCTIGFALLHLEARRGVSVQAESNHIFDIRPVSRESPKRPQHHVQRCESVLPTNCASFVTQYFAAGRRQALHARCQIFTAMYASDGVISSSPDLRSGCTVAGELETRSTIAVEARLDHLSHIGSGVRASYFPQNFAERCKSITGESNAMCLCLMSE